MYAIEFETKIIDGTVRIPTDCQKGLSEYVKVIILMKENCLQSKVKVIYGFQRLF